MGLGFIWANSLASINPFSACNCMRADTKLGTFSVDLLHARKIRSAKIERAVAATTSRGVVRRVCLQPVDFANMEV